MSIAKTLKAKIKSSYNATYTDFPAIENEINNNCDYQIWTDDPSVTIYMFEDKSMMIVNSTLETVITTEE